MAKNKAPKKLPKAELIPTSKPFIEKIAERKENLTKVAKATAKDGKLNKYNPKYRAALKTLKRSQRKLKKEVIRQLAYAKAPAAPAAPAAAAAPAAEAPKA